MQQGVAYLPHIHQVHHPGPYIARVVPTMLLWALLLYAVQSNVALAPVDCELRGVTLVEKGDPGAAMNYLKQAVTQQPSARSYNNLGVGLFLLGKNREAAQAFAEALKLDTAHETAAKNAAWTEMTLEDGADAMEPKIKPLFKRAIEVKAFVLSCPI